MAVDCYFSGAFLYKTNDATKITKEIWKISITDKLINIRTTSYLHINDEKEDFFFLSKYQNIVKEFIEVANYKLVIQGYKKTSSDRKSNFQGRHQ